MASHSNGTTSTEIENRQHEYAMADDVEEVNSRSPSPPPPSRADRGKGIMALPTTPAQPVNNVRAVHRRLLPSSTSNGAGNSRGVTQTENNPIAQTLLGRRSRQDAVSFQRILQARFADGGAMVSGDLSRSIDYAVDRLEDGDKDAMHRLCARKGQNFLDYWTPVERSQSRSTWQCAMDTLVMMEDFIDPDLLRMLDDAEMESYERKFALYGLRMRDFSGTTCRNGIMVALRPFIRGMVPRMHVEPANEVQIGAYREMRGGNRPEELEEFRRKTREQAKEALEAWSILPTEAQIRFMESLLRQIGNTMSEAEKKHIREAASMCKADCSNMINLLKEAAANRRGRHDGRNYRA